MANDSVFLKIEFFLLVIFSLVLPVAIYTFLLLRNAISRRTVFALALLLIALSGIDLVLLRRLQEMALQSLSTLDDSIFVSELSLALYLLPAVFAGIGTNLLSHALIAHLTEAERRSDERRPMHRSLPMYLLGRWRRARGATAPPVPAAASFFPFRPRRRLRATPPPPRRRRLRSGSRD